MNIVWILNQYQLFYQQLKIKLIHLVKYFVFLEISGDWWESLTGAQLGADEGVRPTLPFFEKCPDF